MKNIGKRLVLSAVMVVGSLFSGVFNAKPPFAAQYEQSLMGLELRATVFYVADVPQTVAFYEKAFGMKLRFLHPSRGYAELDTGATLLCFLSYDFIENANLLGGMEVRRNLADLNPIGAQIAFVTRNMESDWKRATEAGATVIKAPELKPWGQTTGYLRDVNGVIVELTTPAPRDDKEKGSVP